MNLLASLFVSMALPASEDTTAIRQGFVSKEHVTGDDHIDIVNAGSAINQGDFVAQYPYFGLADEDIAASSGTGTIHVGQVYNVGAARIGSAQTFYTKFQAVYYDPSDGKFYEATDSGRYLVGYVRQPGTASPAVPTFSFEGLRIIGPVDEST
jgi:hypothetical protein